MDEVLRDESHESQPTPMTLWFLAGNGKSMWSMLSPHPECQGDHQYQEVPRRQTRGPVSGVYDWWHHPSSGGLGGGH